MTISGLSSSYEWERTFTDIFGTAYWFTMKVTDLDQYNGTYYLEMPKFESGCIDFSTQPSFALEDLAKIEWTQRVIHPTASCTIVSTSVQSPILIPKTGGQRNGILIGGDLTGVITGTILIVSLQAFMQSSAGNAFRCRADNISDPIISCADNYDPKSYDIAIDKPSQGGFCSVGSFEKEIVGTITLSILDL
jgi:hypothetical protein